MNTVANQGDTTMSDLMLDVDQAGELKAAFRRGNWTNQEIKRLCEGTVLADVRRLVLGHASITTIEHTIDCDAAPFVPSGWKVEEHQKGGQFKFDASQVEFYLAAAQKKGSIEGNKLRKELVSKPVLNANILDYLLKNPRLIPEDWKKDESGNTRYIFFWGTVYRDSGGSLYVRCLYWYDDGWYWSDRWLDYDWNVSYPAALRAS
ncbi:MAG: hypothetical protein WCT41_03235 [Candidatus Paceibacterota bacterium]